MNSNLLIVSKKWSAGRGQFTSVERFCAMLDSDFQDYHGRRISVPERVSVRLKKLTNSRSSSEYSAPYNSYSFETELWGWRQSFISHPQIIFFPYADYDFYYTRFLKRILNAKIVLWTFFSRRELEMRFANLNHFKAADIVLAAGRDQVEYLRAKLPSTQVEFFPIGVDSDFFQPSTSYDSYRLIHIGNNRRDFDTLIKALDIVYSRFPQMKLDLVGAFASAESIPSRPYLVIHKHLDDDAFLRVIQDCNFCLLSLKDGGSSNSLLEAISCGLPVVTTDLPNIRDYFDSSFAFSFEPGNVESFASHCLDLLTDSKKRNEMARAARNHAAQFSWHVLQQQFHKLVES